MRFRVIGAATGLAVLLAARPIGHRAVFPGAEAAFPDRETLAVRAPGARLLSYSARDGTQLVAAWVPGGETTVVYFHATNQSAADALLFAGELAAGGVSVLVPEHRGYGGLAGRPSREGLFDDAEAAIAASGLDPERTILAGRSLGAAVAAEMARRGRGRALVLIAPFTSVDELAGIAWWAVPAADRFDTGAALAEVSVPVTILHGTGDGLIPFWMGARLADEHGGARFVTLEGAGHNDLFLGRARGVLIREVLSAAGPEAS